MSKKEASIWQIGLFSKCNGKHEAYCELCKENGEKKKFTFAMKNWSTTGLVVHLKSKHQDTDFFKKYSELELKKERSGPNRTMENFVNITGKGKLYLTFYLLVFCFRRDLCIRQKGNQCDLLQPHIFQCLQQPHYAFLDLWQQSLSIAQRRIPLSKECPAQSLWSG